MSNNITFPDLEAFQRFTSNLSLFGKEGHEILEIEMLNGQESLKTVGKGSFIARIIRYFQYLLGYLPSDKKIASLALSIFQDHFHFSFKEESTLGILKKLQRFANVDRELTAEFRGFALSLKQKNTEVNKLSELRLNRHVRSYVDSINRKDWFIPDRKDVALTAADGSVIYLHSSYLQNSTFLANLSSNPEESNPNILYNVSLPHFNREVFEDFADYLTNRNYFIKGPVRHRNIIELYRFADFLGDVQLEEVCATRIAMYARNNNKFSQAALEFLVCKNLRSNTSLAKYMHAFCMEFWKNLAANPCLIDITYDSFCQIVKSYKDSPYGNYIDAFIKALPFIGADENLPKQLRRDIQVLIEDYKVEGRFDYTTLYAEARRKSILPLLRCIYDLFHTEYRQFIEMLLEDQATFMLAALFLNMSNKLIPPLSASEMDLLTFILDQGADPSRNMPSLLPLPFLHMAIEYCDIQFVRLFLQYNAKIDSEDHLGRTPLMLAALSLKEDIVEELLKHGADVNIKNCEGKTICEMLSIETDRGKSNRYPTTPINPYENILRLLESSQNKSD